MEPPRSQATNLFKAIEQGTNELPPFKYLTRDQAHHSFPDIQCPEATAVKVNDCFLHANLVEMEDESYIATGYPDRYASQILLWELVFQGKTKILVDLTKKPPCTPYYPDPGEPALKFEQLSVGPASYIPEEIAPTYTYFVKKGEEFKALSRTQYLDWEDHKGTQSSSLLKLIEEVNERARVLSNSLPIVVHCRAGVGRSGTFIVARTLYKLIKQDVLKEEDLEQKIQELVLKGRAQRGPYFVQNVEQVETLLDFGRHCFQIKTR